MDNIIKTSKQLIKYAVAAFIGLVIDFGSVVFTKEILGLNYLWAVTTGFLLGLLVTYLLSNKYVFGAAKINRKAEILLFTAIGIGGLFILDLLVWVMTGKLGLNYIVSKAIATIVVFTWNFFARRSLYHEI
jgi:putative flippase GtrA